MEQRVDIKLCFTLKEKQLQGARKLSKLIMEKEVLSHTWVFKWFNKSRHRLDDLEDNPWSGLSSIT
jgi:esterase/lipase superfamily enzyme